MESVRENGLRQKAVSSIEIKIANRYRLRQVDISRTFVSMEVLIWLFLYFLSKITKSLVESEDIQRGVERFEGGKRMKQPSEKSGRGKRSEEMYQNRQVALRPHLKLMLSIVLFASHTQLQGCRRNSVSVRQKWDEPKLVSKMKHEVGKVVIRTTGTKRSEGISYHFHAILAFFVSLKHTKSVLHLGPLQLLLLFNDLSPKSSMPGSLLTLTPLLN